MRYFIADITFSDIPDRKPAFWSEGLFVIAEDEVSAEKKASDGFNSRWQELLAEGPFKNRKMVISKIKLKEIFDLSVIHPATA